MVRRDPLPFSRTLRMGEDHRPVAIMDAHGVRVR